MNNEKEKVSKKEKVMTKLNNETYRFIFNSKLVSV